MSITKGLAEYECDRCGYKEFVSEADIPTVSGWKEEARRDSEGVERKFVLCYFCAPDYKKFVDSQDKDFAAFMKEGGNN